MLDINRIDFCTNLHLVDLVVVDESIVGGTVVRYDWTPHRPPLGLFAKRYQLNGRVAKRAE
jgi:hypothetical protein